MKKREGEAVPGAVVEGELLAAILSAAEDGIVTWNSQGTITSWNLGAERIFRCRASQAVGRPVATFFRSDLSVPDSPRSVPGTHPVTAFETFEAVGVRQDGGGPMALALRMLPIGAPSGGASDVVAIIRDGGGSGDARHRLENGDSPMTAEVVDLGGERLKLALAAARLGDWSWDARNDAVAFSARAGEIFGIPAGAHMTRSAFGDLLHADDRENARIAIDQGLQAGGNYAYEARVISGQRERWVSVGGRGTYDARGVVTGMFGVVQDLTADRILVRVDDAVRPLVNPEDITYTAARLVGQYMDVNRCAYATVEDDEDTFTLTGNYTNGVQSIVGRYRFRQFGEECLRLMRAGKPYVVTDAETDPRIHADDRVAYAYTAIRAVICVPILKSGRFVAAMAVHMNQPRTWSATEVELLQQVTSRCWESIERARVEREREGLLQAAQAANRAKDEFMAMLGHELRNPLSPILTALQLMKLRGDVASARERTVIERQVNHLTRLLDDLLDVSRIARGKVTLKIEIIELSEIVTRAIEVASPLLEQRAHALALDVQPTGLLVEGDAARLTQVVANLLTNAGKYTPSGGRISVSAAADGDHAVLRVRDTGIGISPEALPKIFDLFVQAPQAIDRAQGGLGLGLSIVRSLVERHRGSVSAHSDGQDRGSEFVVRLPRASSRPEAAVPSMQGAAAIGLAGGATRILVVDDNDDAAEMLKEALTLLGCEVQVAHDGPKALSLAATTTFDVALLDIGLPVMDGYELAARLRSLPNLSKLRLIAVTGYGHASDRQRAEAAGFQHHLVKPVDLDALEMLITRVALDSNGPASPAAMPKD